MMFWVLAGLLALAAALFVAVPLLMSGRTKASASREDVNVAIFQEQLAAIEMDNGRLDAAEQRLLTEDLQRNLLLETRAHEAAQTSEPGPAPWFAVAGVPIVALVAYLLLGASGDQRLADDLRAAEGRPSEGQLEQLARQLERQPNNHDGRYFLARAWMAAGKHARAAEILDAMSRAFPQEASLKSQFAEALFLAAGQRVSPQVQAAIDAALVANPHDTMLYEIQGIASWKTGDAESALGHFAAALRTTSDPARRELIMGVIAQVTGTGHGLPGPGRASAPVAPAPVAAADSPVLDAGRSVTVLVELDPGVEFEGGETVFVYARPAGGPRMPLAIQRLTPDALPALVKLDASMAMMPNMSLDTFDTVEVLARLSRSGSVTPGEGDVEALVGPLDLTGDVDVVKLRLGGSP